MDNPFKKRATEFIEEPLALLSLTSAAPIRTFFGKDAKTCFDRLTLVIGTPGTGKTTLARLLEIDTLVEIIRSIRSNPESKQLAMTLAQAGVLKDQLPTLLAHRIPCGSNFRNIWELPYQERTKTALLKAFIQVKAALGWIRKLERLKISLASVQINYYQEAESYSERLKVADTVAFRTYARELEESILKIITSLVPPPEEKLANTLVSGSYDIFECIESFTLDGIPNVSDYPLTLRPMIILDDAHELKDVQFLEIERWLRNREIKMPRWVMTRIDAIGPSELRKAISEVDEDETTPGTNYERDRTIKLLQGEKRERKHFRSIARDVCKRYFSVMPAFQMRGIDSLDVCLSPRLPPLAKTDLQKLEERNITLIEDARFSTETVESLKSLIPASLPEEEAKAVLHILLQREKRKTPQVDLFADVYKGPTEEDDELGYENEDDGEVVEPGDVSPDQRKQVKSAVITGAAIQLAHQFDRPFYHSFDRLADASSDNIEQFISLAGAWVDELETRLLRNRPVELDAKQQHTILTNRANELMNQWDFPHCDSVRKLIRFIATRCVAKTMEPNAPLGEGANAFGIPQDDMNKIEEKAPELVPVIHYAIAYNAIYLKENYNCKNRQWCLFQLGGVPIVANRLTLSRGGFCEGGIRDLLESITK